MTDNCSITRKHALWYFPIISDNIIDGKSSGNWLIFSSHTLWLMLLPIHAGINTLRPRQNGRHFADDIFKCIFLNENTSISINISLKFVPEGRINNIPALVQIMAWRLLGDEPLSAPMMVNLLTHICVTRPQWVKVDPYKRGSCLEKLWSTYTGDAESWAPKGCLNFMQHVILLKPIWCSWTEVQSNL